MARRVPLPRLTHRQRTSRWQRERRQQTVIVTVFTAILLFVLGLAAWAASDRYYQANLTAAAQIQGLTIPKREYLAQLRFELVRLYQDYGVPKGGENDPQLDSIKTRYQELALERVVEQRVLDRAARAAGITTTAEQIDSQYVVDFGEYRVRHVLIQVAKDAPDPQAVDAVAKAKARAIADQLREAPGADEIWKRVAAASSEDPGTKDAGGELGWARRGQYVAEFEAAIRDLPVGQVSDPVRTSFGYHVLQVEEKRAPENTEIVKRYLETGYGLAELKAQARYELLRKELESRQQAAAPTGPVEQVHIARIKVAIPPVSGTDFQAFAAALQKQTTVREALKAGTDFAEVAKANSDDEDSKDKGGDAGWFARGMLVDPNAEDRVFSTDVGKTTEPVSTTSEWIVYKILEKAPSRELVDDQKQQIKENAYQYWLKRQKKAYDVQKLLPGLSQD